MALLVFDHSKGWIAADDIHLVIELVGQGIDLGELAETSGLEFGNTQKKTHRLGQ